MMKKTTTLLMAAALMAAGLAQGQAGSTLQWVQANPFTWDNGVTANWKSGGTPGFTWDNSGNHVADFGGFAATVNLGSDITTWKVLRNWWAANLDFNLQGYNLTFTGGGNKIQVDGENVSFANGTIVLASNCQVSPAGGGLIAINASIDGAAFSLTKVANGTLELGAANIYGTTTINDGTLRVASLGTLGTNDVTISNGSQLELQNAAALDDGSTLILDGATDQLNLNFVGTEIVNAMEVDGITVPAGTYTAGDLTALGLGGVFSGTGSIQVLTGAPLVTTFDYHIDATAGLDTNDGKTPGTAWKTLARASSAYPQTYNPGDRILLKRGETFAGQLNLNAVQGTEPQPITIGAYDAGSDPVVTGSGSPSISLVFPEYITVQDLEITGEGIAATAHWPTGTNTYDNLVFSNLNIHGTASSAISLTSSATNTSGTVFNNVLVDSCTISNVTGNGIAINKWDLENAFFHSDIVISGNTIVDTSSAGIQVGKLSGSSVISGNTVTDTAGNWLWGCRDVIVEGNTFQGARGPTDSCGVHIDIGNTGCIIQRNLSIDNEGGFVEILGLSSNNVYRYNISINDGSRENGVNGALQDGRMFWFGGYTGMGNPKAGPDHNYVYNNTVYTKADIVARYDAEDTADGALMVNNIIYIEGSNTTVSSTAMDILFDNNVVYDNKVPGAPFTVSGITAEDPMFANTGGLDATNYIPSNVSAVEDQGVVVSNLPGDTIGVPGGFEVLEDYFGNPVLGQADMGAIEISNPIFLAGWHTWAVASEPVSNQAPDQLGADFGAVMGTVVGANGGGWQTVAAESGDDRYGFSWPVVGRTESSSVRLATYSGAQKTLDIAVTNNAGQDLYLSSIHFDYGLNFENGSNTQIRVTHLSNQSDLGDDPFPNTAITPWIDVNYGWSSTDRSMIGVLGDTVLADGEVAAFRFEIQGINGASQVNLDNVGIAGYLSSWLPLEGYDLWADGWGVDLGGLAADYDLDGWDNLTEYGLGGNPTNGFIDGNVPVFSQAGGGMQYLHVQRNDDANLTYYLELTDDLVFGTWTNSGYAVTGTDTTLGGDFDEVTNSIPTTDPQQFIRLMIKNN